MDGAKKIDNPDQSALDTLQYLNRGLDALQILRSQSSGAEMAHFLLNAIMKNEDIGQAALDKVRQINQSPDTLQNPHSQSSESGMTQFLDTPKQGSSAYEAFLASSRDFDQWLDILQAPESQISALATATILSDRRLSPQWQESTLQIMVQKPLNQQTYLALGKLKIYNRYLMQMNRSKCLFRTANGYFGTAPDPPCVCVEAVDRVALISGLDHPVLLRPVIGGWRLLTHVYLHGIMHGEAWPGNNSELKRIPLI